MVATAHWGKFGADVCRALKGVPSGEPLPGGLEEQGGTALLEAVREVTGDQAVPQSLAGLERLRERFPAVVDGSREGVEEALRTWLHLPPAP